MKGSIVLAIVIVASWAAGLSAQDSANVAGRYLEEKNKITIEVYREGAGYAAKQIDVLDPKKKKDNGKLIAKDMIAVGNTLTGTVISTTNGKEYRASWELSNDRSSLALKIKFGFLSFSDTWKRVDP